MVSMDRLRVLVVDDESLIRAGLRLILDGAEDIEVAGEAADGEAAVTFAARFAPDVVLVDIRMPVLDGIAATKRLTALPQPPRVIVLTSFDTDGFILEALRAGASGFLLKDTAPADIVSAVRAAARDDLRFSPAVLRRIVAAAASRPPAPEVRQDRLAALSERERGIAHAVARGLTNSEISSEFFLSVATVKTHIANAFTKLGVTNRVQLAVTVLDDGVGPETGRQDTGRQAGASAGGSGARPGA